MTDQLGEPCNSTDEVHLVDLFHSLDNLKSQLASVAFCRNTRVYNVQSGAVIDLPVDISINGFPRH